jgi:hypothetical protein
LKVFVVRPLALLVVGSTRSLSPAATAVDLCDPRLFLELLLESIVLDGELPNDFFIELDVAAQILLFASEFGDFAVAISSAAPPCLLMGAGGDKQLVNQWAEVAVKRRAADPQAGRQRRGRGSNIACGRLLDEVGDGGADLAVGW